MVSRQRGFTLIELLVYLAIVGIVLVVITGLAIALLSSDAKGRARQSVEASARRVVERLTETVHAAASIDGSRSAFGTDAGRLTLVMRDAARSPAEFVLSGSVLTVREGGGALVALTPATVEVTRFRLTYLNPAGATPGVRVELSIRFANPAADPALDFTKSITTGVVLR